MQPTPTQVTLELRPQRRIDLIDVTKCISSEFDDFLQGYRNALYCSFHTTAGYLEESISAKLRHRHERVSPFIRTFQNLFPPDANYQHDELDLRTELTEEQRQVEPRNADSHLIFISSGMKNCVTYQNRPDTHVYFIDLDGVNGSSSRCRRTTILGYNHEETVHKVRMAIPVSKHPVDSINLNDWRNDFFEQLNHLIQQLDIQNGRIRIALSSDDEHAGLTVNEYETLLMKHDLAEILHNPIKFMAQKGKHAITAPQLIMGKTLNYAKYDLVHIFNKIMDKIGVSETVIEKYLSMLIRLPASHFLSMKRQISLFVSEERRNKRGKIVFGKYQSPIMVQWKRAPGETRYLDVTISKFT